MGFDCIHIYSDMPAFSFLLCPVHILFQRVRALALYFLHFFELFTCYHFYFIALLKK